MVEGSAPPAAGAGWQSARACRPSRHALLACIAGAAGVARVERLALSRLLRALLADHDLRDSYLRRYTDVGIEDLFLRPAVKKAIILLL